MVNLFACAYILQDLFEIIEITQSYSPIFVCVVSFNGIANPYRAES